MASGDAGEILDKIFELKRSVDEILRRVKSLESDLVEVKKNIGRLG